MKKIKNNNTKKFPKYVSPIINMANRFSRATSPASVGKMSELFKEFKSSNNISLNSWKHWYIEKNPNAIESAVKKISNSLDELKKAIDSIDEDMIRTWVEDLVFDKTFNGLTIQEQILSDIASETNTTYRMADEKEESRGIDG